MYIRVFSDILTSWIQYPEDEDGRFHEKNFIVELEVDRNHYYWQLITPLHTVITSLLETVSQQPLPVQTSLLDLTKEYVTLDLSILLTHFARYNVIINDHSAGMDDATPLSTPIDNPTDSLLGHAPAPSALDDLLGGVAPTTIAFNGLQMTPSTTPTSEGVLDVSPLLEEKYHPLYSEAVQIAKQIKLVVQSLVFPHKNLAYLSRLNDCVRTIQTEVRMIDGNDLRVH